MLCVIQLPETFMGDAQYFSIRYFELLFFIYQAYDIVATLSTFLQITEIGRAGFPQFHPPNS